MKTIKIWLTFLLLFLLFVVGLFQPITIEKGQAAAYKAVVINEIAWMGTTVDYNDEWIELYNNTSSPISLNGWVLESHNRQPQIFLSGTIPPNGYYLIERIDDNTVPGIPADKIYNSHLLDNGGETLYLRDSYGTTIDVVNAWYAGDYYEKITMERKDSTVDGTVSSNWGSSTLVYNGGKGTPKEINSVSFRRIIASPKSLTEITLNGNVIALNLQADTYSTSITSSHIQLNNPPPGTTIRSIERFNDYTVHVTLDHDGTDFDQDYIDFNITVLDAGLVGNGNITSNKIPVSSNEELEGVQNYVTTGTSYPTLIEMTGYNSRDRILYLNSTLRTNLDVTGKTATFHYVIKIYDGNSNTIGEFGNLSSPYSETAQAGASEVQLKNIQVSLSQGLPAAYRIVVVVESVDLN
ncbi:lamin tail domain-containing protein [Bacillus timonensis]|nr:lamin tail domain-containing protein [Bacillus timonensis]